VDEARFTHVATLLAMQEKEARWWRDACVLYFQTFARQPLPAGLGAPAHDLAHYVGIEHRYVPGI
jgi:alpha-glucuronidase